MTIKALWAYYRNVKQKEWSKIDPKNKDLITAKVISVDNNYMTTELHDQNYDDETSDSIRIKRLKLSASNPLKLSPTNIGSQVREIAIMLVNRLAPDLIESLTRIKGKEGP